MDLTGRMDQPWWFASLRRRFRSWEVWAAYLLAYAAVAGYSLWSSSKQSGWLALPEIWIVCLFSPWAWLGGMFWISPFPWQARAHPGGPLSLRILFQAVIFSEAWIAACTLIDIGLYRLAKIPFDAAQLLIYNLIITGPVMVLVGYAISRFEDADRGRKEALAFAEQAQSRLLQSQLHPHVLFNSLNGIAELIVKNPQAAEESVRALSDLLRRLLAAAESTFIPVREERAMVQDYLALEALRLGSRMQVQWEWDGAFNAFGIVPLTLQPLVENAIKHGISPAKRGGILAIKLAMAGEDLLIEVKNTGHGVGHRPAQGMGIGLRNLRERLFLAYGAGASLDLATEGDWTCARVRIPGPILL